MRGEDTGHPAARAGTSHPGVGWERRVQVPAHGCLPQPARRPGGGRAVGRGCWTQNVKGEGPQCPPASHTPPLTTAAPFNFPPGLNRGLEKELRSKLNTARGADGGLL